MLKWMKNNVGILARVDFDEIYCQAATLKLSTWNKNYNLSLCNKSYYILYFPSVLQDKSWHIPYDMIPAVLFVGGVMK